MQKQINNIFERGTWYCVVVGIIAFWLGSLVPLLGKTMLGLMLGISLRNVLFNEQSQKGISFCAKIVLKWAVMFMGIRLSLHELQSIGTSMFLLIALSVGSVLIATYVLQWKFPKHSGLIWLIGFGTAICGSAAIAATSPFIKQDVEDMGTSIAIVNVLGLVGIFALPLLSSFLLFETLQSGLWVGSTLQAVGHVAATSEIIGSNGGDFAIALKMGRVFCLLPLVLWLGFFSKNQQDDVPQHKSWFQKIKDLWYLWGFIFFMNLSSQPDLFFVKNIAGVTLVVAMVGIGLSIDIKNILQHSKSAILYAGLLWVFQIFICGTFIYWYS